VDDAVLDGEAVAQLVAFDLLHLDGEDQRKLPLKIGRAELESASIPPRGCSEARPTRIG
jgi:ATP-dependent DNA ligase